MCIIQAKFRRANKERKMGEALILFLLGIIALKVFGVSLGRLSCGCLIVLAILFLLAVCIGTLAKTP